MCLMSVHTNMNTTEIEVLNTSAVLRQELSMKMNDYYVEIINDVIFKQTLLPSMIYLIILLSVGLPGNILICYLYHNKGKCHVTGNEKMWSKMKSSDIFILALAWLDILNCILSIPIEIYLLKYFARFDFPVICKISRYASMVFNAASSFVLLGISIDRFIGIKYSHSKYRFTVKTAIKFVIVSVILAVFISFPGIVLYGTQSVLLNSNPDVYGKTCLIEDRFVNTKYPLFLSLFLLTIHLLFDLTFVILYGIIGQKIIRNRNILNLGNRNKQFDASKIIQISHIAFNKSYKKDWQKQSFDKNANIELKCVQYYTSREPDISGGQSTYSLDKSSVSHSTNQKKRDSAVHGNVYKASKTTFMLFTVTIVFMLTFAPYCAIAILRNVSANDYYSKMSNIEKSVYQLFLRSYLLSSAANPIIYSFISDKFRQQCRVLLSRIFKC